MRHWVHNSLHHHSYIQYCQFLRHRNHFQLMCLQFQHWSKTHNSHHHHSCKLVYSSHHHNSHLQHNYQLLQHHKFPYKSSCIENSDLHLHYVHNSPHHHNNRLLYLSHHCKNHFEPMQHYRHNLKVGKKKILQIFLYFILYR